MRRDKGERDPSCKGWVGVQRETHTTQEQNESARHSPGSPTSRDLLHEDLDVAVLRDGAQVLDDVAVLQILVEGNLLVEGLGIPGGGRERGV